MTLEVVPMNLGDARAFVSRIHRTHPAPQGGLFAIGAALAGDVVGVVIVGRPISSELSDGWTAEVTRLASDGSRNVCSLLYGAAWRAARALGYRRLVTYTLATPGTSLRAAGWRLIGKTRPRPWNHTSRPRVDRAPLQEKLRWEAV